MYMSFAGCIVSDSESEKGWHQDDLNFISETCHNTDKTTDVSVL